MVRDDDLGGCNSEVGGAVLEPAAGASWSSDAAAEDSPTSVGSDSEVVAIGNRGIRRMFSTSNRA